MKQFLQEQQHYSPVFYINADKNILNKTLENKKLKAPI
jgi:hypothetical protein